MFDDFLREEEGSSSADDPEDSEILYEVGVPEAAASMMEVEMMEPEEKLGPSLGRVLGPNSYYIN